MERRKASAVWVLHSINDRSYQEYYKVGDLAFPPRELKHKERVLSIDVVLSPPFRVEVEFEHWGHMWIINGLEEIHYEAEGYQAHLRELNKPKTK